MESVDIIVSGLLCLDLIPRMENVPLDELAFPGRMFEVGGLDISTGGAVSNTGLALHRLGLNVRLMATVGDDLIGRATIAFLKDRDPSLGELITVQSGQSSSYTVVLSPEKVDRIFLHCSGANVTFGADNVDFSLLDEAKLFHLGYPSVMQRLIANDGEELEIIYQRAKATGIVTSLDTSLPDPLGTSGRADWEKIMRRILPHVDVFIPSIDEIMFMLRRSDYDAWRGQIISHLTADYLADFAGDLLDMGPVITGFKLGEMGLYMRTAEAEKFTRLERLPIAPADWGNVREWSPVFQVDVAGTTGAGDSAYAGFLASLVRGMKPSEAVRWACAVGACNVEASDSTSGIRGWEETQKRMESGWAVSELRLAGF